MSTGSRTVTVHCNICQKEFEVDLPNLHKQPSPVNYCRDCWEERQVKDKRRKERLNKEKTQRGFHYLKRKM